MTKDDAVRFCDEFQNLKMFAKCLEQIDAVSDSPICISDIKNKHRIYIPFELSYHFRRLLSLYFESEIKVLIEKLGLSDEEEGV